MDMALTSCGGGHGWPGQPPGHDEVKEGCEPRYSTYSAGLILALRAVRRVESWFLDWRFDRATH